MNATEQIDVPIFRLPDDVLIEICSYITSIKEKMELEQVCQRFKRVSSDPTSWKGIHSLELMIKCYGHHMAAMRFKSPCDYNVHLNGVAVAFKNWPKAIKSFLHRTQLHQFAIHYGDESCISDIFSRLTETFAENKAKIKIDTLEIHCNDHSDIDRNEEFQVFFLNLFKLSAPYLRELIYLVFNNKNFIISAWNIIEKCPKLKSFTFFTNHYDIIDFKALMGKPLTQLILPYRMVDVEQLVDAINGVSSDGLQSLAIENSNLGFFQLLLAHLTENARNKFKCLSLSNKWVSPIHSLPIITEIFPNIEKLDINHMHLKEEEVTNEVVVQFFTSINSFTMDGSVIRRFTLSYIVLYNMPLETFKTEFTQLCQNAQIDVEFAEIPFMYLSKGKASFVLNNVEVEAEYRIGHLQTMVVKVHSNNVGTGGFWPIYILNSSQTPRHAYIF